MSRMSVPSLGFSRSIYILAFFSSRCSLKWWFKESFGNVSGL